MNYRAGDPDAAQRAMLDFAHKVKVSPDAIVEADRAALRTAGFDDRSTGTSRPWRRSSHDESRGNGHHMMPNAEYLLVSR